MTCDAIYDVIFNTTFSAGEIDLKFSKRSRARFCFRNESTIVATCRGRFLASRWTFLPSRTTTPVVVAARHTARQRHSACVRIRGGGLAVS